MEVLNKIFIGLLALVVTVGLLEVNFTQADCPTPQRRQNAVLKFPRSQSRPQRRRWLKEDTVVTYDCNSGYNHTRGDKVLICLKGKWQALVNSGSRLPIPFQCSEKICPVHDIPNGKMEVKDNKAVTFSCERGYGLSGFQHSLCKLDENGELFLTSPLPSCDPLPECKLPTDLNLRINGSCCFPGDEVTFFCDPEYEVQGISSSVCLPTGNWSQPLPYCTRMKQCMNPGIPFRSNRTGDCCKVGSVLTYECHADYELMDKNNGNSITCLANEEWSGTVPRCKPIGKVACPNILIDKNNLTVLSGLPSDQDVFLDGSEVDLDCKPGFYTEDLEMYLLCDSDGNWDTPVPACKPKDPCSRPLPPSHGCIAKLIENPEQTEFPIWYEIEMECDKGYISQNGHYGSQCKGNYVWNYHLNCTRITCSDPGVPTNGYREGDDFHFNSSVTFSCMGSYQLIGSTVRTCQENGRWSGYTTVCDAGGSDCFDPGEPINSYRRGNNFNIGDVVTYSCQKKTTLIGNGTRECLEGEDGAYWSGSEIECQAQHEFSDKGDATLVLSETVAAVSRSSRQRHGASYIARTLGNANKAGIVGTDVIFAFDGSASITELEFEKAKDFAITLIRQIGVSHSNGGMRVAVIVFSKSVDEVVDFSMTTVGEVTRELKKMKGNKKGTDITKGLKSIGDLAQRSMKTNPHRKKIAFIITDGMWNQGGDPTAMAKHLRNPHIYNVEMYAIGISRPRNDLALHQIVGLDKSHVLLFESHEELSKIVAKAIKRDLDYSACGFERPVSFNDSSSKGNRKRSHSQVLARIVGGQAVKRPWPWMAALSKKDEISCGGSIIHQQWILTAAHCFKELPPAPSEWVVTVGATDLSKGTGWDLRVAAITIHDNYNPENLDFDAALVKLKVQVPYDLYIRPICLPPAFKTMPDNTELYSKDNNVMVIGYGHTEVMQFKEEGAKSVDILQELELKLQAEEVCQKEVKHGDFKFQPTPQMICAGSGQGGKDACKGDSGGPLMQLTSSTSRNNTQERWFLVGIKSWGIGCGLKGYHGYYSYVAKLREWIEQVTKVEFENVIPQPKPTARG